MNKKVASLIKKLENPEREFSPVPFWFLNDEFSDEEIKRQLKSFNEKGVNGVVLHPRIGVPETIQYLSDEFMHYIKVAARTAHELDMRIVLYDEAMYPSGSAHGLVAASNPDFASQCIILSDNCDEGKVIAKTKSGKYILQAPSNGRIRGIHFGEDDGQPNAPLASDLLNPSSVDKFIELTHERYYSVLKEYFGNTVIGFFTDEPSVLGRNQRRDCFGWTWGFEDVITELKGTLEDLEGLFTGEDNETTEIYKKAIFDRECNVYYKKLSDWCGGHGIALMGHPHRGDDIECERFFQIPGQDIVLRWIAPEKNAMTSYESVQAKCSSDAARHTGKRRNLNECYGACCKDGIPWYFTGGDMKWYTDWLAVRGVNFFIPHAFYYSVTGRRKDERPPDVGPNNIWWKYFDTISAYIKRVSCLMTDAPNKARVAVLCANRDMPSDEMADFYQNQVEFNYLPYSFLENAVDEDGCIKIQGYKYEYVYGDKRNTKTSAKHINSVFDLPYRDLYTQNSTPDLRVSHVVKDDVEVFFLTNEGEGTISTKAMVEGKGGLITMDFWTGLSKVIPSRYENGKIAFDLNLARRQSICIMIDPDAKDCLDVWSQKEYVNPEFELIEDDKSSFIKKYQAKFCCQGTENLYINVKAEEMVECYINGSFAGFSLWNDHEFFIKPYIKKGENQVELSVTGSAVNRFTDQKIEYGLL
ncbi:MAG: hypothetical protein Q8882_06920 [Bacillota bacterium]|nr:hypothetical protein [Bacillota bacterium]